MCGIIGYIGKKHPKEILINGLCNLEYRGYDSSGIALKNKNEIQIIKSVGKIKNLEEKINNEKLIDANIGIAHTRWATHGIVNETNAHPHHVGKITIVHNGIIENAQELREKLSNLGKNFYGSTDTEVACSLINYYYEMENDIIKAINNATKDINGSYAFGIMVNDDDNLYAIRKDSPLIIGIGKNEYFLASDISAIIEYTNKYILLDDKELAILTLNDFKVLNNNKKIQKDILTADISAEDKEKNGYEHFMLKEIMEEPIVLDNMLNKYLNNLENLPDLSKYEDIHIVGCGSAMYAGMIGKSLLEEYTNLTVNCYVASEYRYTNIHYNKKNLVILISQSGETADTIAAMRKANDNNIDTLAIVNVKTSTIARESNLKLFIDAGPEIAVATTKAYILQVMLLSLLAYRASFQKNEKIIQELKMLPKLLKEILVKKEDYSKIAKDIYKHNDVFFIGRKIDYAICLEGSLKLKEISYIHSEAYQAGELKHGTISLIDNDTPVIAIVTDKSIIDKTISNIEEVKSRGAKIVLISNEEINGYDCLIKVKNINAFATPILVAPILQYISYEVAKLRDCDIDKPKNLAKSVTVE